MNIIVTGGSGFIGINLIKYLINIKSCKILNIDKLTSTSMNYWLKNLEKNKRYKFKRIDLINYKKLNETIYKFKPDIIFNLAAESHVDTSISNPQIFIKSNIEGTFNILEIANSYYQKFKKKNFKFIHISTDEVYGSLDIKDKPKDENSAYMPNSPYSASKASSDYLVRAWNRTYNLPTIITHCSNNYGPYQYPEKLIPVIILKAISNKKIPIYGNGKNIREWVYVEDHVKYLYYLAIKGKTGEVYNIGSNYEIDNLNLCKRICLVLKKANKKNIDYTKQIQFVKDRKGHDFRYAINSNKIKKIIKNVKKTPLNLGLQKTIKWYLDNSEWLIKKITK